MWQGFTKNRSNIASSILLNPELLENAYNRSVNGQGVAQQELDTFMDSLESRTNTLKNSIQELANSTFDVEWLKDITSLANSAVQGITGLVDAFGGLNTIIGVVSGGIMTKLGGGVLNFDNRNGFISPFINLLRSGKDFKAQKELAVSMMNSWGDLNGNFGVLLDSNGGIDDQIPILRNYIATLDEVQLRQMTLGDGIDQFTNSVSMMSTIMPKATAILGGFASALANIATMTIASMIVSGAINFFVNLGKKQQEIIKNGEEAQKTIQDTKTSYDNMAKSTKELGERYNELRSGVSYEDGKGFTNISLSTDEYEEFLKINTQIADMFPGLVSGISSGGQVFVELGDNVENATNKLNGFLEIERDYANLKIAESLPDAIAGVREKNQELETKKIQYQNELELTKAYGEITYDKNTRTLSIPNSNANQYMSDFIPLAQSQGINFDILESVLGGGYKYVIRGENEALEAFDESIENFVIRSNSSIASGATDLQKKIATIENEQQLNYKREIVPGLVSKLNLSNAFQQLPKDIQDGISSALYNLDYQNLPDPSSVDDYVNNIANKISSAFEVSDNKNKFASDFNQFITGSFDNISVKNVKDRAKEFFEQIFPDTDERYRVEEMFNLGEYNEDTGKFKYNVTSLQEKILNNINKGLSDEDKWASNALDNVLVGQLEKAESEIDQGIFSFDGAKKGVSDFIEYIKASTPIVDEATGKFSDLFPDNKLSDGAEKYEKKLSSIASALEKYREEGKLTSEEQKDLMADLQTGDISKENLSAEGLKTLREYISSIRDTMETMTPEAKGETEKYIDSIVKSYLNAYDDISDKDLSELLYGDIEDPKQIAEISDARNQLVAALGGEYDNKIIATMIVEGDFSNFDGDIQSLIDRYHELEIDVSLNFDEAQLEIIKKIVETNNSLEEAKRNTKEASGESLTGEDYKETIKNDNVLLKALEDDYNKKKTIYENLQQTYNAMQSMPLGEVSDSELSNVASKLAEAREAMVKAETDFVNQGGTLYKHQEEANQADLNKYTEENDRLKREKQQLENDVKINKAKGFEKTAQDYIDENKSLHEEIMNLTRQKNEIRSQITDANRKQKLNDIADLDNEIASKRETMIENRKAAENLNLFGDTDNLIEQLETQKGNIESAISYTTETLGERVEQEQYKSLENTIDDIIEQKSDELTKYQSQVDSLTATYGKDTPLLLSNEEYKTASKQVASLTTDINNLNTDKIKAHNNYVLAGFNEQLDEADMIQARIEQTDRNIGDVQKEIDKANASEQDTGGLQAQLSSFYEKREQDNRRIHDIYDSIGKAFVGVDSEESSKWLKDAVEYANKADEDNAKYVDSEIARISSKQSVEARINGRNRAYEEVVRRNQGQYGTHDYYSNLRKLAQANVEDLDDEAVRLHREYLNAKKDKSPKEIVAARKEYETAMDNLHKEQSRIREDVDVPDREVEVNDLQRQLKKLQDVQNEYDRVINDSTRVTPQDIFTAKDINLKEQLKQTQQLAEEYDTLLNLPANKLTDEEREKYATGLVDALTQIDNLQTAISTNTNDAYSEQLRMEAAEYQKLQQAATEYQDVINNTHHDATSQDYRNLITNGNEQISSLQRQIDIWKQYQSILQENSPEWVTAQSSIDNLSNSITGMTTNIVAWSDAINNLKLDKISQALELNKALQGKDQAELDSEGKRRDLVPTDYDNLVSDQTQAIELAGKRVTETKEAVKDAITGAIIQETFGDDLLTTTDNVIKSFDDLSKEASKSYGRSDLISNTNITQKQQDAIEAETSLIQAQDDLYSTLTQQQQSSLNPLITEYNTISDELDTVTSKIKSMTDNNELVPQSLYDEQEKLTNSGVASLQKQIDMWEQIRNDRQKEVDSGSGLFGENDVRATTTEINALQRSLDSLKSGKDEIKKNSVIAGFNEELEKAKGWESNLKEVQDSIKTSLESINFNEANREDQTTERGFLSGLYESEQYYASLLEDLYSRISVSLGTEGLLEGANEYKGLAQQQHDAVQQAVQDSLTNDIARIGTINPELQGQIEDAERVASQLKEQQDVSQAQGIRRTSKDIADSLASSQGLRDMYQGILDTLQGEDGNGGLKLTPEYQNEPQVTKAVDNLIAQFTSNVAEQDKNIAEEQKNQDLQFVDSLQDRLTAYETRGKEISDTIAQLNEEEKYVSDELYDAQYKNYDRQIRGNEILQKWYENAAKKAEKDGKTNLQKDYEEQATSLAEKIRNLVTQKETNRNQKEASEYQQLEYKLDEYQRQGDALQATIDRVGHVATKEDYKGLIQNSEDQISILQAERKYWENIQNKPELNFGDEEYQKASQNIAQIDSAIQSATNSQLQWNQEINNLPYQKYENLLNLSKSIQNINNAENNKKSAFGFDLLPEDYDSNIEQMTEDVENAKHELGVANAKLLQAGDNVFNGYKLDENGEKVEGLTEADLVAEEQQAEIERNEKQAAVLEAETALWMEQQKKKEAETANSIGRLNDLKQEATEIQNDIDNITTKGGMRPDSGLYQGLIDNMNNQIDEMIIQRNVKLRQQQELENNEFLKSIGDPKNTNIYRTLTSEIEELNQAIFNGGESIKGWQADIVKSGRQNEIDGYLARIEDYERKIADKKREIAKAEREGGDTGTLYSELASLYGSEKFQKEGLQNLYKNIAEAFRTGDNIDLVQATAFDDLARELDDGVENLDASADEAEKKTLEISDEIQDSINSLTDSRSLNESFQKYRESLGGIADESYYEQQKSISEQLETLYRQALSDLDKKYAEIAEPTEKQKLDYQKKQKELLSNIFGEQAQQEEYETAEDLLPVKALEDQAEQYQNVLTELQNSFDEFTEHGGIITDDLYKDQKQTYSNLEDVYENIAKEYDKLADSEKNLEKQNGFRKQAEEARESARQYKDAQKDIDDTLKARQGKSTFSLLLENESDEGISKVTEQFTSQMDSIHELEEQYRTGEPIDIGEIKVKFPRISGIENLNELPEALGEVKTDAITQYLDDYVNVISKYPDAIGEAQQFLVDTMTGFDFKNVNVDRVMKSLTDVFGKQASKGLISEKDAFSILDQVRSILESGGDAGAAISIAMKAAFEEGYDPNSVVDDYNDLEITVKLKSDVTELDKEIAGLQGAKELNNTVGDLEGSKRSYNETQRGFAIPEDFDGEIQANANEVNILNGTVNTQKEKLNMMLGDNSNVQEQFKSFIDDYINGNLSGYSDLSEYVRGNSNLQDLAERIDSTDFTQSDYSLQSLINTYNDLQTAMTDVENAQTEGINLSNQQRDAISNEADQWANFYNALSEGAKQEVDNITENLGGRATKDQLNDLSEITRKEIQSQYDRLDSLKEAYPDLFKNGEFIGDSGDIKSQLSDANTVATTLNDIQGKIDTLTQSEAELVGQAMMAQGNAALEKIDELDYAMTNAVDGYDTQIKSLQADNKDVSLDLLSSASGNLDEQIAQYKELAELADSIHDMYANPESEYYNEGLAKQYDEMAQDYQGKLEQAQQQQRDYGEYILNNAPSIQERVNELNRERGRINDSVELRQLVEGIGKTSQDYLAENAVSRGLIQTYQEQLDSLNKGEPLMLDLGINTDSIDDTKSQLETMINEETRNIAENDKAINEIAITAYEEEAARLSEEHATRQRAIDDAIRDNQYADTSLYQALQNTLEEEKGVQDKLTTLYSERADQYKDVVDEDGRRSQYFDEYTQKAGDAAEASNTFTESLQTNQQAIKDSIDNTPFRSILQNTEGIQNVKSVTDDLQTVVDAVDEYRTMIEDGEEIDWTNLVSELPELTGIAAGDIESLSSALDDLELKKLNIFSDDYSRLLKNLKDPQQRAEAVTYMSNLLSDIDLSQVDSDKIRSKIQDVLNNAMSGLSPEEGQGLTEIQDYINSYLGAGGSEEVALMVALEAAWMGLTPDEAVAQFDNLELIVKLKLEKSELEKDIAKASREIEKNNSKNEAIKSDFGLKESFGYTIDKDEYGALLDQDKDNIRQAELIYNNRSRLYDISKQLFGEESSATSDAFIDMQNAYKDYIDSQEGFIQDTISYEEANNDRYESNLSKLQATASDVQGYLDRAVEDFGTGTAEQYQFLLQNAALQAVQYGAQLSEWQRIRDENSDGKGIDNMQLYTDALEGISSVNEAMAELKASTLEWQLMLNGGIELGQLDSNLSDLEEIATAISDAGSIREGKGLTKTLSQYEALVENGESQIENLHEQNRILQRQQNTLGITRSRWREIQSTINGNNSAIAQMRNNIADWNASIRGYNEALGRNMLDALTNAFSESMSPTGLTTSGMDAMLAQFADLSGFDTSAIFYNTAQGIKLDVDATKMLVDAQYQLRSGDLKEQIDKETEAYKDQVEAMKSGGDAIKETARIQAEAHRQNLDSLWQQLAQYQALYAQEQYLFSDLADVERALSSENAGAKYEQIQGYGENYKKLYESGLVGTDDFKEITALLTQYGRTTEAAYEEATANLDRYFTEDISGVVNFFNDLVSKGYATGSAQEGYDFAGVIDEVKAAGDLGITTEVFDYLLGRSEDYGASIQAVKSEIDGQLKLQETQHDILDSIERKNELMSDPRAATALQEEQEHLESLRSAYDNYTEGIEMEATKANQITSQQIQTGVNIIKELGEEWDKAVAEGDERYQHEIENKIREISEKYGAIPLQDIEGKLTVDTDALNAQYEGWAKTVASSFSEVSPDFVREGFDISKDVKDTETWESAIAKVQENYSSLTDEGDTALQQLQALNLSAKELSSINMTDGMLDSDTNLAQAEKLLDTLADMAGLTGEERQNMSSVLDMFGLIGEQSSNVYDRQSNIVEQIQDNMETVNDLIESQQLQADFEIKDVGDLSIQGLENQIKNLEELKASIDIEAEGGEETIQAIDSILDNNNTALVIKTELEGADDARSKLLEMAAYSDEEIMAKLEIDADTEGAESKIESFRANVDSLISQDISVRIQAELEGAVDAQAKLEEMRSWDDTTIMQFLEIDANTENASEMISDFKSQVESMEAPQIPVTIRLDNEQYQGIVNALTGLESETYSATLEIEADTSEVENQISSLEKEQHSITIQTQQIPEANPVTTTIDTSQLQMPMLLDPKVIEFEAKLNDAQLQNEIDAVTSNKEMEIDATVNVNDSVLPPIEAQVIGEPTPLVSMIESLQPTVQADVTSQTTAEEIASNIGNVQLSSTVSGVGNVDQSGTISYTADTSAATSGVSDVVAAATSAPAQMNITANNNEAIASGDEAKAHADGLTGIMTIDGNNNPAISAGYAAVGTINGMSGTITVNANASSVPGAVQSALNSQTYTVNVTANVTTNGPTGGYTGTLLSPSYARGSVPKNSIVVEQGLAKGQVGLKRTQKEALVNELGDESYITPDGQWRMFQHGMHVEKNLKRGTIILNHEQTESLIKSGKASGRGQIQGGMNAFASGTDKVLMNAYASGNEKDVYIDPTNVYIVSKSVGGHFTLPASYNGGGGSSDSGGGSDYSGGGDSGGSSGGGGGGDDSGDTPQFSYEIFDHVERALDLLARSVDNAAKKIQDYMTPFSRKTLIKDQIEKLEKQFDGVNKAIETYRGYLSVDGHDMLHAYEYADDDGNKATVDIGQYFDLDDLRNGNLTKLQYIDTTDPAAKAAVEGAQKWLEYLQKAEDAEDQLLDIISDIHDAALQIMEIPLDELDKTLEKLDSTISHINSMIDIISSNGATGIHMLKRAVNEGTGYRDAANAYTTAKANYTEARSNVSQSKANIKELTSIQKEANSDLTSSQKTLTKALKKSNLSKKDKDAIKERMNKGKKVSTKGITDKTLKDAIKVWNANIVTTRTVQEGLKDAQAELSKNTKAQKEAKKQMQKALEQRKSVRAGLSPEERAVAGASISKPWYVAANEWVDASTESTRQKVEEARATLAAQQKITDEQKKQSDEAGKQLLASQNLTKEQRKQIQSGEKLDITENMTEAELKLATIYNLFFEALELFNDAKTQLEDTEIEYAEALMNQIEQHYNNLKDYYDDLRDWNGTLRENLESTNDLIGKTGRSYQTSGRLNINRQLSMGYLETDIQLAEEEIKKLQEEVDSEVASGDLIVGDKVWHDRMKPIYELQVQINKTKVDIIDLYTEMANVPVEDATSKIEELRESLKRLTTFGDKGLGDTIQLQRTYYEVSRNNFAELVKQAEKQLGKNSQAYKEFSEMQEKNLKETRKYSGGEKANDFAKTFLGQNDYLETQVNELKKEMQIRQDTLLKTEKELQNLSKVSSGEKSLAAWSNRFLGNRDTDKYGGLITALKKYKTGGSTFYSIFKDYIDAGAQIDKNSEEVDTILNYKKLSDEQKELLEYLISHYNRAVNNFDVYNAKLFAAETANNQALADFYEAQADYVKAKANLVSNQLSNINTYMEVLYGRTKTYSETFESIRDELKEIGYDDRGLSSGINYDSLYGEGTGQIAKSYENQIKYLEKYASQVSDSIKYQIEVIRKAQEDGSLVKDSEDWKKAWNTINSLEGQVRSTVVEIDKLYHEMQDTVIFKPIRDAIDDIQRLRSNISSVLDLISDDMKLTKDGDFTELGLASLTGQLSSYQSTLEEIEKTLEYQRKLTDEYNRQETITSYTVDSTTGAKTEIKRLKYTTEEYTEAMEEAQKKTQDALKNAQTYRTQIINAITTRYKTEIDYISELIDKRKEALQKQKEMNDYDKTLKNKTNEIQKIEQQIRALETLSDIESTAQKKRLEAELQEQQQDLDDTIQEHVYDLRTEGLDDIKQELQDNYEKFTKDLQINIDSIIKTINDSAGNIEATLDGTNRVINSFLSTFNTNLGLDSLGAEEFTKENTTGFRNLSELQENANDLEHYNENYSARQYETLKEQQSILESTKDIESDIYGNTEKILQQTRDYNYSLSAIQDASERNADGGFVTANGTVLTPLDMIDVNDSFIDALLKASENANMFRGVPVNNGFDEFGGSNVQYDNRNISNNINVGSLITVNGDVDNNTLNKLQTIADGLVNNPKFMEATYDYITQESAREARKHY